MFLKQYSMFYVHTYMIYFSFLLSVELTFLPFLVKEVQMSTTQYNTNELLIYQMLALTKRYLERWKSPLFYLGMMNY